MSAYRFFTAKQEYMLRLPFGSISMEEKSEWDYLRIKSSICNGEQVAGFKDLHTGKFEEIMLIRNAADLEKFKVMYDIQKEIEKEY